MHLFAFEINCKSHIDRATDVQSARLESYILKVVMIMHGVLR